MQIIPGILTDDMGVVERHLNLVVEAKKNGRHIDWLQVDFIDGIYANNWTLAPTQINLRPFKDGGLLFEAHLMVGKNNWKQWLAECRLVGFHKITAQVEPIENQIEFIYQLKNDGYESGLSIDVQTPVSVIDMEALKLLDVIQVMTVKAGAQGQRFIPEMLEKVRELHEFRSRNPEFSFKIQVDGGVKVENVKQVAEVGVDLAVVGSGLFGGGGFEENLRKFYEVIGKL